MLLYSSLWKGKSTFNNIVQYLDKATKYKHIIMTINNVYYGYIQFNPAYRLDHLNTEHVAIGGHPTFCINHQVVLQICSCLSAFLNLR